MVRSSYGESILSTSTILHVSVEFVSICNVFICFNTHFMVHTTLMFPFVISKVDDTLPTTKRNKWENGCGVERI